MIVEYSRYVLLLELDASGAFQNGPGKAGGGRVGPAKLNRRSLTKEEINPASFEASGLF